MTIKKIRAFLLTALICASLQADVIYLKNGEKIEGRVIKKTSDKIYIKSRGMTFSLSRREVDRIEIKRTPFQIYQKAIEKLDADNPDQHVSLGNWCDRNGLPAYAKKHWKKAIDLNPDHEKARKALGFERYEGEWMTHAAVMKKKGFVLFEKKWVTPEMRDTVLYERAVKKYLPDITSRDPQKREQAVSKLLAFKKKGADLLLEKLLPMKKELLARYRKDIVPAVNNALTSFRESRSKLSESQNKTLAAIGKRNMCELELANINLHKQYRDRFSGIDMAFKSGKGIRNDLYMIEDTVLRSRKTIGADAGTPLEADLRRSIDKAGLALYIKEKSRMKRDARIMAYNDQLDFPNDTEKKASRLYNEYRILTGLTPYVVEKCLSDAARDHSKEMVALNYFGHVSPKEENKTFSKRIKNAGYDGSPCAENCASYPSPHSAVAGWLHSTGHHRNIAHRKANELGMGFAGVYTATFGKSKTERIPADFKTATFPVSISYDYFIRVWNNPKKK